MQTNKEVSGAIVPYYGGKWIIAPWIISHMPTHALYVEPFGGAASVLLRKPRAAYEIYNDLDESVVSLFRALRDKEMCEELIRKVTFTPYSRVEHKIAWDRFLAGEMDQATPVERAYNFLIRARMSFASAGTSNRTSLPGFENRAFQKGHIRDDPKSGNWKKLPPILQEAADRLQGVVIEHKDVFEIIPIFSRPRTDILLYFDPPYIMSTKTKRGYQTGSFGLDEHERLLDMIQGLQCMVMLSGYSSELYLDRLQGWHVEKRKHHNLINEKSEECLWLNPVAWEQLQRERTFVDRHARQEIKMLAPRNKSLLHVLQAGQ